MFHIQTNPTNLRLRSGTRYIKCKTVKITSSCDRKASIFINVIELNFVVVKIYMLKKYEDVKTRTRGSKLPERGVNIMNVNAIISCILYCPILP